jgi:ATP-dependent helicase/nuclease subunit A
MAFERGETPLKNMIHSSIEQRHATSPQHSCWVEASAGTGKTKVLTDRVLNLLLMGAPAEQILCLTFTKAAAAEMANRIQEKLAVWASLTKEELFQELQNLLNRSPQDQELERGRRLFSTVIDTPGGMKIQTIHSFCQTILKKFPLEAEIPPHFKVMDEGKSKELLKESFQHTLKILPHSLLETLSKHASPQQLFGLFCTLSHKRPKVNGIIAHTPSLDALGRKIYDTLKVPFRHSPLNILEQHLDNTKIPYQDLLELLPLLAEGSLKDQKMGMFLQDWLRASPLERARQFNTYQLLFITTSGEVRKTLIASSIAKKIPTIVSVLTNEAERLQSLEKLYHHSVIAEATEAFTTFILCCFDQYKTLKASDAVLDYDDLIHLTANLFQKPDIAPWVLYKLDGGIQHILVDEAQDTNEYQWQVIGSIATEFFSEEQNPEQPRTLFVVGDMKQSIYSFQGANPAAFQAIKDFFANSSKTTNHPWKEVNLSTSFRSTEPVLSLVDNIFQKHPRLSPQGVELPYLSHKAHRVEHGGHVEIWPLMEPQEKEERSTWAMPDQQIKTSNPRKDLAQRIAQEIQTWIQTKKILPSKNRPIRPQDIMILVRRRDQFVEELVRALKNCAIPVTGVDRLVLTDHIAVMDLLVLGDFLLLPEDDLSLATILKSPLIRMMENDLFDLAHNRGKRSLWHVLKQRAAEKPIYAEAFALLTDLMNLVDFSSPFELYTHVLNTLSGRQKMVARLGTEVEDALEEFLNLTLSFSEDHIASLQAFLSWIREENMEIKRNLEQDGEKVRIMTVHGAKGLQAPIVFLPDTTQVPLSRSTLFWNDTDPENPLLFWCPKSRFKTDYIKNLHPQFDEMAEYYRLLYVALTRAEDQLYICGWQPQNALDTQSWYKVIWDGAQDIAKLFAFDGEREGLVIHQDPMHNSMVETLQEEAPLQAISTPAWLFQPAKAETAFKVIRPSNLGILEETMREDRPTVSSIERGILIHKALEWLVKEQSAERLQLVERFLSSKLNTEKGLETLALLQRTLALLQPYFTEGIVLTEVPLHAIDSENKSVIKGAVDFIWIHDETKVIHIIDYKTGYFDESTPTTYRDQLLLYKKVVEKIYPDYAIQTFILWTSVERLLEVV